MPYVSFVESAGADLRVRTDGKKGQSAGSTGASLNHFAESGRFFYEMIELSKLEIPTVCVVFGSSTAGRRLPAGDERLQRSHQEAVDDLSRWAAAGKDGDRGRV